MKELTKGYPAKVIMMFALPLMAGFIFQQLYNICDSKIVSTYVSTDAFAAIGATGVVSNTLIGFINGLTQGFAIPVANCFGASDFRKMKKNIAGSIVLTAIVTVILTALSLIFIEDILMLLRTPTEIMPYATAYVKIILAGIVLTAIYNLCANILRAVGDSKTPLYCLLIGVVFNIVLDILFVKGFGWKIQGAAYATLVAQAVSGILCLLYIIKRFKDIIPEKESFDFEWDLYKNLITTGLSMGLMSCIVNIGTIVLQGAINSLGKDIVAAHTAARRVFDILTVVLYTVGIAMTTFVSQNVGAGKMDRVRQGVRHAIVIVTIETTVLMILCFALGRIVLMWITSTDNTYIIDSAVMYSRVSIMFFYILGPLFILRCTLQGLGRKVIPVLSSVLEMVVKVVSASLLVPVFGYVGVAFTEPVSWIFMTILLTVAYVAGLKKQDKM